MVNLSKWIIGAVALMAIVGKDITNSSNSNPESRIIGGRETQPGQYKFMVHIIIDNRMMCGGSMIAPNLVLTAAHCTTSSSAQAYRIRGNIHDLGSQQSTELRATKVIRHPQYQESTISNDIALIQVQPNPAITTYLRPDTGNTAAEGTSVRVVGWGKTAPNGSTSKVLKELDLDIISSSICQRQFNIFNGRNHFCAAGKQKGHETCQGDSGGPVITSDQRTVVGIVSYGAQYCNQYGAAYSRVSTYINWINQYYKPDQSGSENPSGNPTIDNTYPKGKCTDSGDTVCFSSTMIGVCINTRFAHQFQCPENSQCMMNSKGKGYCA